MEDHLCELAEMGAYALDNLEDAAGRIALILGLAAQETGYYGGASRLKGPAGVFLDHRGNRR